jgi:hypothetical protein
MCSDAALPDDDLTPRDDEIVAEVRATRERLGAAVGHDMGRLVEQLKAIEAAERERGRTLLAPPALSAGRSGASQGSA